MPDQGEPKKTLPQKMQLSAQTGDLAQLQSDRGATIMSMAVRRAMAASAFDVLEAFRDRGWDVNDPAVENRCPIIAFVMNNETKVRWCLERGADPNARNKNKYSDVPSHAGNHASVSTFQLLAAHGANFACSNALQRAAESESQGRIEALQWLLDEGDFPINQREFEYDPHEFWNWGPNGLGSALHYAVLANSPERVRFLLERGSEISLEDTRGRTPRQWAHDSTSNEVLAILDSWGQ